MAVRHLEPRAYRMVESHSEHELAHCRELQGHMMTSLRLGDAEKLLNPQAPPAIVLSSAWGPSTQYLRTLVPKTSKGMVLGPVTSNLDDLDLGSAAGLNYRGVVLYWCSDFDGVQRSRKLASSRGSKYPIFKDSGPNNHILCVLWDQSL